MEQKKIKNNYGVEIKLSYFKFSLLTRINLNIHYYILLLYSIELF